MARAGTAVAHVLRHISDDGYLRALVEREQSAAVFEKDSPLGRRTPCERVSGCGVEVLPVFIYASVRARYEPYYPLRGPVYASLVQLPASDGELGLFLHERTPAGHVQIASGLECAYPVVHGPPVRNHRTGETPFVSQYVREEHTAVAAVNAVDLRVCAHHRGGTALLHSHLKGRKVHLPERPLVHHTVRVETVLLLGISREMLEAA